MQATRCLLIMLRDEKSGFTLRPPRHESVSCGCVETVAGMHVPCLLPSGCYLSFLAAVVVIGNFIVGSASSPRDTGAIHRSVSTAHRERSM